MAKHFTFLEIEPCLRGDFRKKNRQFKDIYQIGEGGVKLKPEIQNDFNSRHFFKGRGGLNPLSKY